MICNYLAENSVLEFGQNLICWIQLETGISDLAGVYTMTCISKMGLSHYRKKYAISLYNVHLFLLFRSVSQIKSVMLGGLAFYAQWT